MLGQAPIPKRALDVGCGTARNAAFLATEGVEVLGFDSSPAAIAVAEGRLHDANLNVDLRVHDLLTGLPADDGEVDLVLDVFVYKHLVDPRARRRYRGELRRVLSDEGRVLISVAEPGDGYYGSCPPSPNASATPHAILDPVLGLSSVLFSLHDLVVETADALRLEMAWQKVQLGEMHGRTYQRRTLATLWSRRT
jgi:SAM-dependent methyltransferase